MKKKRQLKQEWQVAIVFTLMTIFILAGMALMGHLETVWNIQTW